MTIKRIVPDAIDANTKLVRSPTVTGVSNQFFSATGGETISVYGSNFQPNVSVYIGTVAASTVTRANSTSLTFSTPSLSPGTYSMYVVNENGGTAVLPVNVFEMDAYWSPGETVIANLSTANRTANVQITLDSGTDYTLVSGSLPGGINFYSGNARVVGNIANIQIDTTTYNFTVSSRHTGYNIVFRKNYSIVFTATYPTWVTQANLGVISESAFSTTVTATSDSTVTYSLRSALPSGFNLNANTGVISGNISAPDATVSTFTGFTTTIRAIDQEYNYTDKNFTIYYRPTIPTWTTGTTLAIGYQSYSYTQTVVATGYGTLTYSVASGSNLPVGLTINASSGLISGTPTTIATTLFTLRATDQFGHYSEKTFSITIFSGYIQATGGTVTTAGGYKTHTFLASDNFSVTAKPPGAQVSVLIVGGGGGGGAGVGGGGGAGGYTTFSVAVNEGQTYPITVGGGGAGATDMGAGGPYGSDGVLRPGSPGNSSSAFGNTAAGGGYGAGQWGGAVGGSGSSGGGAASGGSGFAGGTGSQGYAGGSSTASLGGAGGGAGGAASGTTPGIGITLPVIGGLGAGGGNAGNTNTAATTYGGGAGGYNGTAGWKNEGLVRGGNGTLYGAGGGGGGVGNGVAYYSYAAGGGAGYTGVVIIRYPFV